MTLSAKMVRRARDWNWSSYRIYESGEPNVFVDLLPSFEGLARSRKRAAQMFAELVNGVIVKQDDGWTRSRIIGTEIFIKRILGNPHDPLAAGPPG